MPPRANTPRRRAAAAATAGDPDAGGSVSVAESTELSTVEDDQAASGETNVDSPQEIPASPELRRYRVTRAHDGRAVGEELELVPDGHTQTMINLGHLSEV